MKKNIFLVFVILLFSSIIAFADVSPHLSFLKNEESLYSQIFSEIFGNNWKIKSEYLNYKEPINCEGRYKSLQYDGTDWVCADLR